MNTKLIKLFNVALVENTPSMDMFKTVNQLAAQVGYFVHPDVCNESVLAFLKDQTINLNATFYKNWQDVISKTRLELAIDQVFHYLTTYGTGFSLGNGYVPNDGENNAPTIEFKNFKVIMPISSDDLFDRCWNMLCSGVALKEDTMQAVADYVITMAYDEYYSGSEEAGPVSSLSYVKNAVTNILNEVPAKQSVIGLPFYSRMWKETTRSGETKIKSEACSMKYAEELVNDAKADITWDEERGLDYAEYTKDGTLYKIWLENAKSLELKLKEVESGKMAGVAFWKAGMEKKSVWDTIEKYTVQ